MAGWDGQAQDVGAGARVAGGDGGGEAEDFWSEDSFGGHHAFEFHQFAGVVAVREAGEEIAVDQAARETDTHSNTGLGDSVQLRGDQVVEVAVEVRG